MKILIIHYRYFISGGPERYLFNLKGALEERGYQVIPFSIKNSRNEPSDYEKYFVRNIGNSDEVFVSKYPKTIRTYLDLVDREFYSFSVRRKLEKLIRDEKPDVAYILVYKRALSPSVIDACKKYHLRVVNRISDYNPVCGSGSLYRDGKLCHDCLTNDKYCLKYRCVKNNRFFSAMRFMSIKLHKLLRIDKKIDAYVCTNQYMKDVMAKYGYSSDKLNVIPTFFKESDQKKMQRVADVINANLINFLFIGNIDESKGIYDLLDAIVLLKRETTKFHLFVVGGLHIEENEHVMSLVRENDLDSFITFVPFITNDQVFEYYQKANVTVLPTRWVENLPNTLIESIYFNRPLVVPDFGSFMYTTDETVAFKYEALSSRALYECLLKICNEPWLIEEKSKNCRAFFEKHYSESAHLDKLLTLFGGTK